MLINNIITQITSWVRLTFLSPCCLPLHAMLSLLSTCNMRINTTLLLLSNESLCEQREEASGSMLLSNGHKVDM